MPDFAHLPLQSIVGLLVILGAIDTIGSIAIAIPSGTFSGEYVTSFLASHVGKVWFPIFGLGLLGVGIPGFGIPAIEAASIAAGASLLAYLVATIASLKNSFDDRSVVAVPTPVESK